MINKEKIKNRLKNLVFMTAKAHCSNEKDLIENLCDFVIATVNKEVKYQLHQEKSLKASAEYKNKAGQIPKGV